MALAIPAPGCACKPWHFAPGLGSRPVFPTSSAAILQAWNDFLVAGNKVAGWMMPRHDWKSGRTWPEGRSARPFYSAAYIPGATENSPYKGPASPARLIPAI